MYPARWLTATEAQAWGLVNQVVSSSNFSSAVLEYADVLNMKNPEGLVAMKQQTRQGADLDLSDL